MGKVLQIRVIATTWNDELLEDYWPRLTKLAFSVPIKLENHGVLEMVRALSEGLRFAGWPDARKTKLGPGIEKAASIREAINASLADWDPKKANDLSNRLEETLDKLELAYV